jgi:hypothetical protein
MVFSPSMQAAKNGLKLTGYPARSVQMAGNPVFFRAIHLEVPRRQVMHRLGYRRGRTRVGPDRIREVEAALEEAAALIELRGSALVLKVTVDPAGEIALETGEALRSTGLARMLSGSEKVLLMGATAGPGIMEKIRSDTLCGNLSRAVVLDAAASEMTDCALDWISAHMSRHVGREGLEITPARFSAGFGDFGLENQKTLHELLGLKEIGVEITGAYLLVPEKSVTAVAGIRKREG